jgi:hypothetical protein
VNIDGAHQKDEDFAYFHLPPVPGWSVAETTLFGISCNRQIASKVRNKIYFCIKKIDTDNLIRIY